MFDDDQNARAADRAAWVPSLGIIPQIDVQICLSILHEGCARVDGLAAKVLELLATEDAPERRVPIEELLVAVLQGLEETTGDVVQGWRRGSMGPGHVAREVSEVLSAARVGLGAILASDPELELFAGEVGEALHAEFSAAAEQLTDLCRRLEPHVTALHRMVERSKA